MKLGLWLLIAAAAFLWFNHAKKQRLERRMRSDARPTPARGDDTASANDLQAGGEPILACARCGLHVPASDALFDAAGGSFCCAAHRRLQSNA